MNMQIFNNLFHLNFLSFECEKKSSGGLCIRKCFQELQNIYRKQRRIQNPAKQQKQCVLQKQLTIPLTTFAKGIILDVCQGSACSFEETPATPFFFSKVEKHTFNLDAGCHHRCFFPEFFNFHQNIFFYGTSLMAA